LVRLQDHRAAGHKSTDDISRLTSANSYAVCSKRHMILARAAIPTYPYRRLVVVHLA
jgi:hypothetical protein